MNPFVMLARYQVAYLQGWLRVSDLLAGQYLHWLETQAHLLGHPVHRWHDVNYRGPDLSDHYGRRSHDVDIERI